MFSLGVHNVTPRLVFYKNISKRRKKQWFCQKNVFFITKCVIFIENFVYYSLQLAIFYEKQQNPHTIPFH